MGFVTASNDHWITQKWGYKYGEGAGKLFIEIRTENIPDLKPSMGIYDWGTRSRNGCKRGLHYKCLYSQNFKEIKMCIRKMTSHIYVALIAYFSAEALGGPRNMPFKA